MSIALLVVTNVLTVALAAVAYMLWRMRPPRFGLYPFSVRIRLEWPFGSSWVQSVKPEHVAEFTVARHRLAVGYITMLVLVSAGWALVFAQQELLRRSQQRLREIRLTQQHMLNRVRDSLLAQKAGDLDRSRKNMIEARLCCHEMGLSACSEPELLQMEREDTLQRVRAFQLHHQRAPKK